ncbi:MAG: hypothetical protein CL928_04105, partial [Deltaproteobacteria bacterium]|nr:hypothetical protein [Deltaproteobacteria bacterium]
MRNKASLLVVVLLLLAGVAWLTHAKLGGPPLTEGDESRPDIQRFVSDSHREQLYRIAWTGDTMLGAQGAKVLKREGLDYPFRKVESLLKQADYAIGNSEAPITKRKKKNNPERKWSYNTKPKAAQVFADAGFNAMGLANNHTFDRGEKGIRDTRRHLKKVGMEMFGAGLNRQEAARPLLINTPHGVVGVVGIQRKNPNVPSAKKRRAGTLRLGPKTIAKAYKTAIAAGARWVVAYVHWGANYEGIKGHQKRYAREFAKAGFDLVVGHGSHTPQMVSSVGDMPVFYSLGNFVFTTPGRFKHYDVNHLGYGLIAHTFL